MSFTPFHYSKNWQDPADFPTHQSSEEQNRADMQRAYTEWETYWNNVFLPELVSAINDDSGGGGGGGDSGGPYLPLSGGIMRGVLRLLRSPQMNDEAATKSYVDAAAQSVITDSTGDIAALQVRATEIEALVQDNQSNISSLDLRAREIEEKVTDAMGEEAVLQLMADQISLSVSAPVTDGERVYSSITLRVGPNQYAGQVLLNGDVDVSGQISADALYAAFGDVADLVVDRFSTSRRIVKYLAGDTSDDNFVRAENEQIEWVAGIYAGGYQQATNPSGLLLYWQDNPNTGTRGADGYPRDSGGVRIFTTTQQTEWPVYVYTYNEQVKGRIAFQVVGTDSGSDPIYAPVFTLGAGNAQGYNQGTILKGPDGLEISYVTPTGQTCGIKMNTDATISITGMDSSGFRKAALLDFSGWNNGYFQELLSGESTPRTYRVNVDSQGRPSSITDADNHMTVIHW